MTRMAIRMPKMSMTMTEGEVSEWMVGVGDEVAEGDVVCEVMTDKVDMEVESTVSGILVEIAVAAGMANVGDPIGWVEGEDSGGGFGDLLSEPGTASSPDLAAPPDGADAPSAAEAPTSTLPVEPSAAAPAAPPVPPAPAGPVAAVPRARGLAAELGIDLDRVTGTGPDGLVLVRDVEQLAAAPAAPAAPAAQAAPAPAPAAPSAAVPAERVPTDRRTTIRKAVARAMIPSATIPQFTVWREVRLDAADAGRTGLSWTTLLLRAYAAALREVPDLLSRWEGDAPTPAGPPSVALAVATDRGLLVPTFAEPDLAPVEDVDAEVREVVRAARSGRLDPAYLGLANGSLSNLGGLGVDRFQALLTPPQASVLALGSIRRRPVAVAGGLGTALTVEAGLTVDHRVADGAHAAELLDRFARRLGAVL